MLIYPGPLLLRQHYAVYLSKDRALVEANSVSVRIAVVTATPCINDVNTSSRGAIYYWRVNSTYPSWNGSGRYMEFPHQAVRACFQHFRCYRQPMRTMLSRPIPVLLTKTAGRTLVQQVPLLRTVWWSLTSRTALIMTGDMILS